MLTHPAEALRLWDSVVTMGAFDGVHRGHQALIRRAVDRAARLGVPSVAYIFDPPPKASSGTRSYSGSYRFPELQPRELSYIW